MLCLLLLVFSFAFGQGQGPKTSAFLFSLVNYLGRIAQPAGLAPNAPSDSTLLSKGDKKHAKTSGRASRFSSAANSAKLFSNNRISAVSSTATESGVTCLSKDDGLFVGERLLGDYIQGNSTVFFDLNANGVFDGPAEIEFVNDDSFATMHSQSYDVALSTSDNLLALLTGKSIRQINGGTFTLNNQFIVPDIFSPIRYAPRVRPETELGPNGLALATPARSGNLSCATAGTDIDTAYWSLTNKTGILSGFNSSFPGTLDRYHQVLVYFDENGDNIYNPWERTLSASRLVALQNDATNIATTKTPFSFNPLIDPTKFRVTFSTSSDSTDDSNVVVRIVALTSTDFGTPANQELILHASNLADQTPACGVGGTIFVAKDVDSGKTDTQGSVIDASFYLGSAERTTALTVGTDVNRDASIHLYRPIVDDFDLSSLPPNERSSNQFALICDVDKVPVGAALVSGLSAGRDTVYKLSATQCTGIATGTNQLTLGDQPTCSFNITFLQQTNSLTNLLARGRFMSYVALLSNMTQAIANTSNITAFDTVVGIGIPNVTVALGAATPYAVSRKVASSGLQKITFQHNLQRNQTFVTPDTVSIAINFQFNYTACPAGGPELQLELFLLATTIPFPAYSVGSRGDLFLLFQDPACLSFTGGGFNNTGNGNGGGDNDNDGGVGNPNGTRIQHGVDNTLTALVIIFVVFLLLICCIWIFTY